MTRLGVVESLYRFPVKSLAGEVLDQAFVGYAGIYGDRLYAFKKQDGPAFFPYLTARDCQRMLLYKPRFRHSELARQPKDWAQAEAWSIGVTPVYGSPEELVLDVEAPDGEVYDIGASALADQLSRDADDSPVLSLCYSDRALTDGRPVSLISTQTLAQLSRETDLVVDGRRFRANIYVNFDHGSGFSENDLVGRTVQIGERVRVAVVERDPRCVMITFDPDTGAATPALLRQVTKAHNREAGVYAAVLVEGMVYPGDVLSIAD